MKYRILIYTIYFITTILLHTSDINAFIADDYPVTDDMLKGFHNPIQYHNMVSFDKAWFVNYKNNQAMVIELYTDYHRLQLIHFNTQKIPGIVFHSLELHIKSELGNTYKLLDDKLKPDAVDHFLKVAKRISPNYFKTNKGFSLGMSSNKAKELYGSPTAVQEKDGGKLFLWDYIGEFMDDDKKSDLPDNYVADSYGYHIKILFKNDEAIVIIMENDIP